MQCKMESWGERVEMRFFKIDQAEKYSDCGDDISCSKLEKHVSSANSSFSEMEGKQ